MIAAIVLAAGASRRLGQPKQLVRFEEESLVHRAARAALEAGCEPVVVVLGSEADAVAAEVCHLSVVAVLNPSFMEGMSSSIRVGVERVLEVAPDAQAVLITVCDQVLVGAAELIQLMEAPGPVACARYAGRVGVPAKFAREFFPHLMALSGDSGARQVIVANGARVAAIEMPQAALDVDTPDDLKRLDE